MLLVIEEQSLMNLAELEDDRQTILLSKNLADGRMR